MRVQRLAEGIGAEPGVLAGVEYYGVDDISDHAARKCQNARFVYAKKRGRNVYIIVVSQTPSQHILARAVERSGEQARPALQS
jgi:hypothetical protein